MHSEFWHERWAANQIGFHQSEIHPDLLGFFEKMAPDRAGRILVPMCGKSLDLLWLHGQGLEVLGVELVAQAVAAFFAENNLACQQGRDEGFVRHQWQSLQILGGDFFALANRHVERVTLVYDRGGLEALPPALRLRYVRHLRQLLASGVRLLLVVHEYEQEEMAGPPFSVSAAELAMLYGSAFTIEPLSSRDTWAESPTLRQRGLTWLRENAYLLIKK